MFVQIGTEITFFGCGLCVLQAVESLISRRKRSAYGFFFYLSNSIIMLGFGLTARGVPLDRPESIFLFFTALSMIGPLDFFYYHTLLYPGRPVPYRTRLQFIPAAVVFVFEVFFQLQPYRMKHEMIAGFFREPSGSILFIPLAAISLHITAYAIIIIKTVLSDVTGYVSGRGFRFVLYSAITIILEIVLLFGGFFAGNMTVFVSGCVLNVCLHVVLYIGVRVNPVFFSTLKRDIRKKRYEKSMLEGLDTGVIGDRLAELMRDEELYCDSEISLASVAGRLGVTSHQLSQLLNERINTGFWDYVNQFRIEDAKKLLREHPEASIITVCYRVGFNSKSSFNAAFKKMTGLTPREFKSGGRQ
jgi:AraC-like DNA-binding protein